MRIKLLIGCLCFWSILSHAQNPTDLIRVKEANEAYLDHLIVTKLDSIRIAKGNKHLLAPDSTLFEVAKFHALYLSESNKTTHIQQKDSTKTLPLRLRYLGVTNYEAEEIVQSIYIHRPTNVQLNPNDREKVKVVLETYEQVANYFVTQIILNHLTDHIVLDSKYRVIGASTIINPLNDCVKLVVLMGSPNFVFQYKVNPRFFPYSNYQNEEVLTSFEQNSAKKVDERPYKIKETDPSKCTACAEIFKNIKLEVKVSGKKVYLLADGIQNTEAMKKFLASSKNGFMLESIHYEDYHPGNPAYYSKATRRNNMYLYNGEIQDPVMGELALKGFNETKGNLKLVIGTDPKYGTFYEFNVYFIYKGKLCDIRHFSEPVGNPLALYQRQKLAYDLPTNLSQPTIEERMSQTAITVSHIDNAFVFDQESLKKQLDAIYAQDSLKNKARIELVVKTPIIDKSLVDSITAQQQIKKFQDQLAVLVGKNTPILVDRSTNLKPFLDYSKTTKNNNYKGLNATGWESLLTQEKEQRNFTPQLQKSWQMTIIYTAYQDTVSQLNKKYFQLLHQIDTAKNDLATIATEIKKVQSVLFQTNGRGTPLEVLPLVKKLDQTVSEKQEVTYNHLAWLYNGSENLPPDTLDLVYASIRAGFEAKNTSVLKRVNFLKFSSNEMSEKPYDINYRSNLITQEMTKLQSVMDAKEYQSLGYAIDIKLTYYYKNYSKAQALFESNINTLYDRYKNDENNQIALARTLAYYNKTEKVNELIASQSGNTKASERMTVLSNKINQEAPGLYGQVNTNYMNNLIESYQKIGQEKWCEQFVGKGNISFQVFDYLPVYKKYCESCAPYLNPATKDFLK
jgi:hypothetical protein